MQSTSSRIVLSDLKKNYSPKKEMPLAGYAVATLVYNGLLFSITNLSKRRAKQRDTIDVKDLILAGIATHKLSRIISKDAVTSFIRAPFTRYQEPLGYGELMESPRQQGRLEVVAEILNCNYCMSAWVGLAAFWGLLRFPESTRFLLRLFSSIAISDFLHVFYEETRTRSNVLTLREEKMEPRTRKAS